MMVVWTCRYYEFCVQWPHVSFELHVLLLQRLFFERRQVLPVVLPLQRLIGKFILNAADQKFVVRRLQHSLSVTTTSLWSGALWSEGSPFWSDVTSFWSEVTRNCGTYVQKVVGNALQMLQMPSEVAAQHNFLK